MAEKRESVVDKKSLSKWHGVGVVICSAKEQDHIGVVTDDKGLSILHLHTHDSLRLEPLANLFQNYPYSKALITRPSMPPERAVFLSAVCLRIHKKQGGKLPFGFGDWRRAFGADDAYTADRSRTGLTCATFVLSVLELAGYVFFDFDTWGHRDEDIAWQIKMVNFMRSKAVAPDHIAAVDASVDGRRFRPAEVAAGFSAVPDTLTQDEAAAQGMSLRSKVL